MRRQQKSFVPKIFESAVNQQLVRKTTGLSALASICASLAKRLARQTLTRVCDAKCTVHENLDIAARPGQWTQARVFELFPNLKERLGNMGNQLSGG